MTFTKAQKALLKAIQNKDLSLVQDMLEIDDVNPNFPENATTTPLHEAVRQNSLPLVRLLVDCGANPLCYTVGWVTPRTLAQDEGANKRIISFLKEAEEQARYNGSWPYSYYDDTGQPRQKQRYLDEAFNQIAKKKKPKPRKPKTPPRFTKETLPEIFKAEKWVGQVDKMQEEWKLVPKKLKKKFDIAAAVTEARQQTLKSKMPAARGIVLKKASSDATYSIDNKQ